MTTYRMIRAIVNLVNYDCKPLMSYLDVAPRRDYIRQEVAVILNELWGKEGRGDAIASDLARMLASQDTVTFDDVRGHLFDSIMENWY